MISDKAVAKSVANGFEPAEHFKAVQEVDKLYQKARLKETHKDSKSTNPNVLIHRYNADLDNANALITLKESLSGDNQGNKIYTLELEALELKPSAPEPQGSEIVSRNTGYAEPVTPTETLGEIVAQDSNALLESTMKKFNYDERKAKDLLEWHKDSHPLTKDENGVPKAENMLESKAKAQGQKVEIEIPKEKDFKTLKLESESYLNSLKDTTITNKETGMQATIARKGTKEIISNVKKSVANGFSFNEHFAVASNLKEVFENANFAKKLRIPSITTLE